jgi:hypothetical protein
MGSRRLDVADAVPSLLSDRLDQIRNPLGEH